MQGRRWMLIAMVGAAIVLVAFILDVVLGVDLNRSTAAAASFIVLVGAVLVAGACYQHWSTVDRRTTPTHVMAATALLGGALVASSVFGATGTAIFGDVRIASLGVAALVVAMAAAQRVTTEKTPR